MRYAEGMPVTVRGNDEARHGEEAVITLHGLTKRFAGMDKPAVAPLDWHHSFRLCTGLVGPDGAGKRAR